MDKLDKSRYIKKDVKNKLFEKYKQCANFPNSDVIKNYYCRYT